MNNNKKESPSPIGSSSRSSNSKTPLTEDDMTNRIETDFETGTEINFQTDFHTDLETDLEEETSLEETENNAHRIYIEESEEESDDLSSSSERQQSNREEMMGELSNSNQTSSPYSNLEEETPRSEFDQIPASENNNPTQTDTYESSSERMNEEDTNNSASPAAMDNGFFTDETEDVFMDVNSQATTAASTVNSPNEQNLQISTAASDNLLEEETSPDDWVDEEENEDQDEVSEELPIVIPFRFNRSPITNSVDPSDRSTTDDPFEVNEEPTHSPTASSHTLSPMQPDGVEDEGDYEDIDELLDTSSAAIRRLFDLLRQQNIGNVAVYIDGLNLIFDLGGASPVVHRTPEYHELLSEFEWFPIIRAAHDGTIETFQTFFENESINSENKWKIDTALRMAAKQGHLEIVKLLLEKGADARSVDELGNTPLLLSATASDEVTIELLKHLLFNEQMPPTYHEINAVNAVLKAPFPAELEEHLQWFQKVGERDIASELCCPVGLALMRQPMIASDGYTYEEETLRRIFKDEGRSPMTRAPLEEATYANRTLQSLIQSEVLSEANEEIQKYFKEATRKLKGSIEQNNLLPSVTTASSFFNSKPKELTKIKTPNEFVCPITGEIMENPVVASDGYSYEKEALNMHLEKSNRSPKTREEIEREVYPNRALESRIEAYRSNTVLAIENPLN